MIDEEPMALLAGPTLLSSQLLKIVLPLLRQYAQGNPINFAKYVSSESRRCFKDPTNVFKDLKTGYVSSASGSAYLELHSSNPSPRSLIPATSSPKFSCTVHGPKPLQRNSSYSANLQLNAHVKFAPFASRNRRSYIRDVPERDLSVHLESALKGAIIADRWPKSALDVTITVLEGEEDQWWGRQEGTGSGIEGCGLMTTLSSCITVASAALADAGIDCLDLITGGCASITNSGKTLLDPCPSEDDISACCIVGYMPARDEITEVWFKGDLLANPKNSFSVESLIDTAVAAAHGAYGILQDAVRESAVRRANRISTSTKY